MKKSALASVKSDRWRHLAPKYQTFGSIRVLKTGRFNFFSLHHYPQHKCGETLSPRCNGCVSMTQWWWARSSLSESRQPMEVKLEQLLRLQTTEGKRWNIETNLELSLISGQWTLEQRDCTDIVKEFSWSWIHLLRYCNNKLFLAVTVSQKILYDIMHRERQFSPANISDCFHHPAETLPSCFFSDPPPSPDQSAVLESSLQQTMACSISSAIGNNCAEYTQATR